MIYFISGISSILSGMGIGGGSLFILLVLLFNLIDLNEARTYNLAMFIGIGIMMSLKKFQTIKNQKKKYIKAILIIGIGSIIGFGLNKFIEQNLIKKIFYYFMLVIGIYEIIVSLKNIKKDKNMIKKGE